ncbi:MtrB/PioB family decaheme-associated outer membrane protein [Ferrimonas aestuarii]|uniref:MtrB/PioB family decaheme-associated outer membrane protein n=1 Tax=Ferrimonas aestuarii TaxID=2569539 RepID=A0A4U1BT24_9GAMM|nr:MtrB/PioB family decaheme-associated outer membrane protein [Ferrimonas aestuarii]TKB58596.1 MtrB/PioB family decaheme-associated outer membrane protein [Ferrimonas aestuarii]
MNFRLNLITLALAGVSGMAMAGGYSLQDANLDKVNTDKWNCKRCSVQTGANGTVGLAAGVIDSDNERSANAFGGEDGAVGAVNADLTYLSDAGYGASFTADNLGMDNGRAHVEAGHGDTWGVALDYGKLVHVNYANAESEYGFVGNTLVKGDLSKQSLQTERERYGAELSFGGEMWQTWANFKREDKTGKQAASFYGGTQSHVNFAKPIDSTTDTWEAGVKVNGERWFTSLSYLASAYDNNLGAFNFDSAMGAYQDAPSNEAYQVIANGQYGFGRTNIAGRFATGEMTQDDSLLNYGNGISSFDGKVTTTDVDLKLTSLVTNKLRLTASFDYSDRDVGSSVFYTPGVEIDAASGNATEYTAYDTERTTYKVGASYRIASGYRVDGGYDRKEVTRSGQDREETTDDGVWARLRVTAFDKFDVAIKGGFNSRDGSSYQVQGSDNDLTRRYYLADRDRTEASIRISHNPTERLSVDLNGHYALDDYKDSEIGLTEAEDYSYDLTIGFAHTERFNTHLFVGQQWITSEQSGSVSGPATWDAVVEDDFFNAGFGFTYTGLMADKLVLGGDYVYADSESNTVSGFSEYDDYFATSHNLNLYGAYALSKQASLRLDYRFEGYEDADYAVIEAQQVNNLVTLGDLNSDYNAHMVMLSFNYQL